jgi:hypothetical protein
VNPRKAICGTMRTSEKYVLAREGYWKDVLLSREFGYNKN